MSEENKSETLKSFKEEFNIIKGEYENSVLIKLLDSLKTKADSRPLVLYGAAKMGKTVLAACRERGVAVSAFCDRSKHGDMDGVDIISPSVLCEEYKGAFVIITSFAYQNEILKDLLEHGFSREQIILLPKEASRNLTIGEFEKHLPGYEWAYDFFLDEASKQLVIDKIRLVLCNKPLQPNISGDEYLSSEFISLNNDEIIVDGGAHTGDTAKEFLKAADGNAVHIYSFEPDKENCAKALRQFAGESRVTVVQKGLWSMEAELSFISHPLNPPGSSFVLGSSENVYTVPVTSLDAYFKGMPTNRWPTFIKMDIEGAEREALLGAAEVIKARKPKLAICAYHKTEDVYELPQAILSIRGDYRFALRQYEHGDYETVLYAV